MASAEHFARDRTPPKERAMTTTTPSLDTLSRRIAYEIARAGDRAMRELYPDLPDLHWTRLDDGKLVGAVGGCHLDDGTLARWVERLGLVEARADWDRPGLSRYVGTVDGVTIEISGITDRAAWDARKPVTTLGGKRGAVLDTR